MYIVASSRTSLQLAITSGHSRTPSWSRCWGHFRLLLYPSLQRRQSWASTAWSITSPTHTSHLQKPHPLTHASTAMASLAHGGLSQPWPLSLHTYPPVHRHRYAMWQRHTGRFQQCLHNGQVSSFDSRQMTSLLSTYATTLALHWQEACMEWWQTQGLCYVTAGTFARRGLSSTAKTLRSLSGVRGSEY